MKSKVKERMLYSSCKAAVIQIGTEELGLTIDKNVCHVFSFFLSFFL